MTRRTCKAFLAAEREFEGPFAREHFECIDRIAFLSSTNEIYGCLGSLYIGRVCMHNEIEGIQKSCLVVGHKNEMVA